MLAYTLGLRYGLTGNTDIYGSGSYLWHEERNSTATAKPATNGYPTYPLKISHILSQRRQNPALIGFESTVYEKSRNKASSAPWLIGATTKPSTLSSSH